MSNPNWSDKDTEKCRGIVSHWVAMRAIESNPCGLDEIHRDICSRFLELGFTVNLDENTSAPHRPLICATRESNPSGPWLGFWGHYDVEPAVEADWSTSPWNLEEVDSRWVGRGVGDNLVPLAQRLILFGHFDPRVNLVYYLQGEEEIGSPFAESQYGSIEVPPVDLWVEETGYFYKDGRQRLMVLNENEFLNEILLELQSILHRDGREWTIRHRPLNKAFGAENCPCLNHLLGDIPYIAIGPNDDYCTVHGIDESVSPSLLPICADQLHKVVEVMVS
jgi:acetylornithine deacetylase/succinyl-diaminopimelate desuccinylase-like protein